MPRVLIIDDDRNLRFALRRILDANSYNIDEAGTGEEGLALVQSQSYDVILLDLRMPGMSGIEVLEKLRAVDPRTPVVMMTAFGTTDTAIQAIKMGAFDFVLKPFEIDEIQRVVARAVESYRLMTRRVEVAEDETPATDADADTLIGRSRPMQEVYKQIGRVAQTDASVLITGPSGSGKELVARAIYQHSKRAGRPFLAVNCAAIPEGLLESELFGHERGAFTSADHRRLGKFERADKGTLFLDEIGDMSPMTQAKILRVLQEGVIERVGGAETIEVDVRVIAATHRDLPRMAQEGTFREDLYYRLNTFTINLPPLAERPEDIPLLVRYFIDRACRHDGRPGVHVLPETMDKLMAHQWRGNVRELENVINRALIVTTGNALLPESIVLSDAGSLAARAVLPAGDEQLLDLLFERLVARYSRNPDDPILSVLEREMLARAMKHENGNQVQAARLLGISRQTLRNRLADEESTLPDEGM
ncbi:MAG TPA: sigma-54 dependent transcriptional regulator [bacterium]|nr:sigma-54 dependent transcriptional regulator [bacterium]